MNKKHVLTIFLIAILSIGIMEMGSVSAMGQRFSFDDYSNENIFYDDSNGNYEDVAYADVNYSSNNDNNPVNRFFFGDSVDIYFDGESTTLSSNLNQDINYQASNEILDYISNNIHNSSTDVETMKKDIKEICNRYGSVDCTVNIDSIIGEDQIPYLVWAQGESMLPTIQNGQYVLVNKTHDIHVGDIVSVDSKEYGGIMKRVDKINGDNVYLVSDNKNVYYQTIDGITYEYKGLCTWVDISEIEGVAVYY